MQNMHSMNGKRRRRRPNNVNSCTCACVATVLLKRFLCVYNTLADNGKLSSCICNSKSVPTRGCGRHLAVACGLYNASRLEETWNLQAMRKRREMKNATGNENETAMGRCKGTPAQSLWARPQYPPVLPQLQLPPVARLSLATPEGALPWRCCQREHSIQIYCAAASTDSLQRTPLFYVFRHDPAQQQNDK